tara:strand:+ start:393 stop:554 length:162 start_codon:yes stop_codon:yes gene_type:complete
LFEYCILKDKICPHAGIVKGEAHCGLKTGSLFENKIENMTICPYKPKKRRGRR